MYCKEQRLVLMLFFSVGMIYILQYGSSNTPAVDTEFRPALLLSHGMALTLLNFYTMRPFFFFRTLAAVALLSVSCSKSDAVDPNDPNAQLPDPSGTITLSMRNANSGTTYLADSNIYIDKADNFTGATFVSLGPVRGLGNVNYIPKTGWVSKIAVVPGEGYVAYSNGTFYRIYVTGYTTNVSNEIIGAEVKYQTPFGGADEAVTVANTTQTFGADGEVRDIPFTNKGVIPCMVAAEGACTASLIYADDYSFLPIGVRVEVKKNDFAFEQYGKVVVATVNGRMTEIAVKQQGGAPTIWFEPSTLTLEYNQTMKSAKIQTNANINFNEIELSCDADWCKVSNFGQTVTVRMEQNDTEVSRSATITARTKDGSLSASMTVVQKTFEFTLSAEELNFDRQMQNSSVTLVTPATEFSATSSDPSWCSVSWNDNLYPWDDKVMIVRVTANDTQQNRVATITVSLSDNQSKTIQVAQSRYMIGDHYEENGVEGVVFAVEGLHGKLLSMDQSFLQWSVETVDIGATDENDGMANINKIKQIPNWQTLYPAFAWCEAKNTDGVTGWYLPAKNELKIVFDNSTLINNGLRSSGGATLKLSIYDGYWTSTQFNSSNAYYCCYYNGSHRSYLDPKTESCYVRAVRAF